MRRSSFCLVMIFYLAVLLQLAVFLQLEAENSFVDANGMHWYDDQQVSALHKSGRNTDQITNVRPPQNETKVKVEEFQYDNRGVCLSPERDTPWAFDGTCEEQPYLSIFSSTGPSRSCGFCGYDAAYLRELRDKISAKYKERCKDLVVYGAALGGKYEKWMSSKEFLGDHTSKVVKRHGTCFFQFVTDANGTGDLVSADGSQNLIVLDPARMPYKNNRRNTKVLKFNPGLLFPWADRAIWQDAKLQKTEQRYGLPSDYLLHFNRTVQHFGTCSSFMGLPHHKNAVHCSPSVNLKAHCEAIVNAAKARPTVSDDLDVVRTQCERGVERLNNFTAQESRSEVFDRAPMVDTAFIVYDMRTPDCRQFNGNLGCSLLDEIHCYSDRDQISFPVVVANSKLRLSPMLHKRGHELRDRVYINENDAPMLHVSKRSCHWYYRSFSRCVAPEGEDDVAAGDSTNENKGNLPMSPPPEEKKEKGYRVAIVVAGTLQRFMLKSTIEHLINPMMKSTNVTAVDYYVSLTTAKAKAYRSNWGYMGYVQPDPILPRSNTHDHINIEEFVRKELGKAFAKIGALQLQESIDIDSEPMLKARREMVMAKYPNEDPDQWFPTFDKRSRKISERTANANRNLLRMHLAIQHLWTRVQKWEAEEGFRYDFVIFLRDDSLWLNNFDIMNIAKREGDIFVPSCDARVPPIHPRELNDHILISRREAAGVFGNYYFNLFQTDVKGCMDHLPEALRSGGVRGCNSEMLLKWVTEVESLKVTQVSQREVAFQRSANIKLPDGSNRQCFHKFCQSKDLPMQITDEENKGIKICKNIDWDAIFTPVKQNQS